MKQQIITDSYLLGIQEGRALLKTMGQVTQEDIHSIISNIDSTLKMGFSKEISDTLRGERDFWKHQLKKGN